MESTDLFSHPEQAEHATQRRTNSEPVQNPEFSDRPNSGGAASSK